MDLLNFLNQPWVTIAVAVTVGFGVTYLTKISPKQSWEAFGEWPSKVLFGSFVTLAAAKATPRLVFPESRYVCDRQGIELTCRTETRGEVGLESPGFDVGGFFGDFFLSLFYEFLFGSIGSALGLVAAKTVLQHRHNAAKVGHTGDRR